MDIHEYQARELLREHGIPVPPGEVATTSEQAGEIARKYGGRVVIKAQVHAGGRGKAGGVKLADGSAEARKFAEQYLCCSTVAVGDSSPDSNKVGTCTSFRWGRKSRVSR